MTNDLRQQIYNNLNLRETEDLLEIWQNGDPADWEKFTFEIIEKILVERLGGLPAQATKTQLLQILDRVEGYLENNELDQALSTCESAIQLDPDNPTAYVYRGEIYEEKGLPNNAIADYQRAIQLDPESIDAWGLMLNVEEELEEEFQESAAKQHLDEALEFAYGDEPNKALEECEAAKPSMPGIALAYNYLGLIYQTLNQLDQAIDSYGKAIQLNARFYPARENIASARLKLEEEQYRSISKLDPGDSEVSNIEYQESEIQETDEPIPQWLYLDEKAFTLSGWPGHRFRQWRTGYDPLDTDFEFAHIMGVILRSLILFKFRTHNPIYLLMMIFIGLIFSSPLLLLTTVQKGDEVFVIFLVILVLVLESPYWIFGTTLIVNAFLSLRSAESDQQDKKDFS
jgi:tetratricopeptide (TPR) repeat protein